MSYISRVILENVSKYIMTQIGHGLPRIWPFHRRRSPSKGATGPLRVLTLKEFDADTTKVGIDMKE